jgi:hypothetical protein
MERKGKQEKNGPLCLFLILFITNGLDADLQAVLCKLDILLLHGLFSLVGEIVCPEVHLSVCVSQCVAFEHEDSDWYLTW